MTTEEVFGAGDPGKGIEMALSSDNIRKRHIATRASNRRAIVVYVVGDAEFEGYSIGLDAHSLQLLELPSGDVSSIALNHIVAITDGKSFSELSPDQKDVVDRRTASFRKMSQAWLVKNWPSVYDKREDSEGNFQNRPRVTRATPYTKSSHVKYGQFDNRLAGTAEGSAAHVDQEVRDRASESRDQS